MIDYSRNITPICCHAHRVNRVWEEAETRWVNKLTIEPQTLWFERNRAKNQEDKTKKPTVCNNNAIEIS